jgi:hypothetical protein
VELFAACSSYGGVLVWQLRNKLFLVRAKEKEVDSKTSALSQQQYDFLPTSSMLLHHEHCPPPHILQAESQHSHRLFL